MTTTGSYYVSTPHFTVRMDVHKGRILPTSARFFWRLYGDTWSSWMRDLRRIYPKALRVVCLTPYQEQAGGTPRPAHADTDP